MEAVHKATGISGARASDSLAGLAISSIDATRIIALIRASTGVELDHPDLFDAADFQALAEVIDRRQPTAEPEAILPGSGHSSGLISHSQERMAFLHRMNPDSAAYHVFGALDLRGPLDLQALEKAYEHFLRCHPVLRTRTTEVDGLPRMTVGETIPPIEMSRGEVEDELRKFARHPFDLASEPPIRLCLIPAEPERNILGLCAHHVAADGWSARILIRELARNYDLYRRGITPDPKPTGPDFIDYAAWQRKRIDDGVAARQIEFWRKHLEGHDGRLELATDFSRPPTMGSGGGAVIADLPDELESAIERLARSCRATPFMVRFAAWLILLRNHGGGNDLVSAVPVANRHHEAAGDLVGSLVNTLPLRVTLDGTERFLDLLDRVRTASFDMQGN